MKMEGELKELKMVLRSLVVSSPTEVDLRTLLRDYRNMMGVTIPFAKFGYRDGLSFIKEQCSDCFVVQESSNNPVLTLIVPDAVKHIDKFVQKQKVSSTTRFRSKRRSVPEEALKGSDLIVKTFRARAKDPPKIDNAVVEKEGELINDSSFSNKHVTHDDPTESLSNGDGRAHSDAPDPANALQNFMKRRIPMLDTCQYEDGDRDSSKGDTVSERQTSSSNSSSKRAQLEELKMEVRELIGGVPEGVWCTELMRFYREKYGRELNFARFGFTSVLSFAYAVDGLQYCVAEHTGELLLLLRTGEPPAPPAHPARLARPARCARRREHATGDPEDALPGIDFDADVFPRDSMHLMQSIPPQSLDELATGAMLEVVLGEVYSPTHFWLLRLGPAHYSAMEALMDEMNVYYRGEGAPRVLAGGAVRVGHYCACCYLGDWHRAVVVKVLDSDTVKVRHIDYATVETVAARALKPLLRRWAALPAQAIRGRLAGVRPPAAGRRWPWAAAAHFLDLVKERRLVANVVAKDAQEGILEVLLIDTSTEDDVCIGTEMCRSGHAEPRPDSALGTSECYLYPRFDALETGDTPNYAEIYCYLRDGISLEFVEDYRRHVPPCLPPPESRAAAPPFPSPSPSPPPVPAPAPPTASGERAGSLDLHAVPADNRVPLLRPGAGAGLPPRGARSLPTEGFPAAARPQESPLPPHPRPQPSLHLSPLAPTFYPQTFAPDLRPDGFPGVHPAFYPDRSQFNPVPHPPPSPGAPGGISLSASECEIFALLSRVDPAAAHRYMVDALSRAMAAASLAGAAPPPPPRPPRPAPGFVRPSRSRP